MLMRSEKDEKSTLRLAYKLETTKSRRAKVSRCFEGCFKKCPLGLRGVEFVRYANSVQPSPE